MAQKAQGNQLSLLDKITDAVKDEAAVVNNVAHKMIAEVMGTQAKPAEAKAAPAHTDAAKPDAAKPDAAKADEAKHDAAKPADKPAAAAPKTVTDRAAAVADQPAASGSSLKSAIDVKEAAAAATDSNMLNAASFIAAALPEFTIIGATVAVAAEVASTAYSFAVGGDSDKAKANPATDRSKATKEGAKAAAPLPDLHQTFNHVTENDAKATYKDWLASTGCESGDSCKVSPIPVTTGLLGGMFDIKSADSKNQKQKGGRDTSLDGLVSTDTYNAVFKAINMDGKSNLTTADWQNKPTPKADNDVVDMGAAKASNDYAALINKAQLQDMKEPSGGHLEGSGKDVVHYNEKGQVDWEKHDKVTTKIVDGVKTVVDDAKHTMKMTNAQGQEILSRGADNHWKLGLLSQGPDSYIDIDPKTQTFTYYDKGVPHAAKLVNGKFEQSIKDTNVAIVSGTIDLTSSTFNASLGGKSDIKIGDNGAIITSADGSSIYIGRDGSAGVHMADGKSTITYDAKLGQMTLYRDGQEPIHLDKDQIRQLFESHSKQMLAFKAVVDRMQVYMATGKLENGTGGSLHTEGVGPHMKIVAMTADVTTAGTGDGKATVAAAGSQTQENIDTRANTSTLVDTKTGKPLAKIGLDAQGHLTVDTPQVHYNGANDTASINGTKIVANASGVNYGDGTHIGYNGTVVDKYGTTFNNEGVIVEMGSASYTAKNTNGAGGNDSSQENTAKNQVAQAESIASSVRGMIAGGHATAGAIAALQSSIASLSVLIGSLSQFSDSSALASAVMAQDDVAGSLDLALNQLGNKSAENKVDNGRNQNQMLRAA